MFALVRAAGGGPWLALGATGALAADNLFSVHGRIATLDIYVLAFMLGGVALYLRRRPVLAGIVLGGRGHHQARRRLRAVHRRAARAGSLGHAPGTRPRARANADRGPRAVHRCDRPRVRRGASAARHVGAGARPRYPWAWLAGHGTIPYLTHRQYLLSTPSR